MGIGLTDGEVVYAFPISVSTTAGLGLPDPSVFARLNRFFRDILLPSFLGGPGGGGAGVPLRLPGALASPPPALADATVLATTLDPSCGLPP